MYSFGKKSQRNLIGVDPELAFFTQKLISISDADFSVFEGVRSIERQRAYFERGVTDTMDSYHLYGLAVDLVPYIGHRNIWDGPTAHDMFEEIHKKGMQIIREYNLSIQNGYDLWGWDRPHWQKTGWKDRYDVRKLSPQLAEVCR